MTNFEITERVVQTGYVDKDGKFIAETDPNKVEALRPSNFTPTRFVQTDEDVID